MNDENVTGGHTPGPDAKLYRIEVEDLAAMRAPVLLHTLRGSLDAGSVGELVADHLLESLPATRVVTFDADELIDYRSRRPPMEIENFRYSSYEEPVLAIDLLHDDEGHPLLLLHGSEPDLRWEAFTDELLELVADLGVERTLGVHGFPAPVPHTRPAQVQSHGDALPELEEKRGIMLGRVRLPGSASGLFEYRLQQEGRLATGLSVGVPHYLAQNEYPAAAAEAVRWISRAGNLALPVGDLEAAAAETALQIAAQVEQSPEVAGMVHQLEMQFDQYMEVSGRDAADESRTLPSAVPSAEEIGAEAEAFLAKQGSPGLDPEQAEPAVAPATELSPEPASEPEPGPEPVAEQEPGPVQQRDDDADDADDADGQPPAPRRRWPWQR